MSNIASIVHESWHQYLQPLFDDPKMELIKTKILPEYKFYPPAEDIFKVFAMPIDKVKVVIIGQDPYPNGEATGLAFAVKETIKLPASLDIIRKEILSSKVERDTHTNIDNPKWRTLSHWKQQGVFLLNTALTVEARNSGSHINKWEWFTKRVINILSTHHTSVWLLWGSKAKGLKDLIHNRADHTVAEFDKRVVDSDTDANYYIMGNHPAAEAYPNSSYKFTGCNHFNICNRVLKAKKQTIINW